MARAGSVGVLHWIKEKFYSNNANFIFTPKTAVLEKYLWFILLSLQDTMLGISQKSAIQSLREDEIENITVYVFNDKKSQDDIVKYLTKKTELIDSAVLPLYSKLSLFSQYKKSLINECVSGGVNV